MTSAENMEETSYIQTIFEFWQNSNSSLVDILPVAVCGALWQESAHIQSLRVNARFN